MKNQRILFISPQNVFDPSSGVESRINNVMKLLSKNNELVIFAPKQKIKSGQKNFFGFSYKSKYKKVLDKNIIKIAFEINKQKKFDLIYSNTLWAGINSLIISKKLKIPFYFDNQNVEFLRFKRTNSIIWPFIYLYELLICKMAKRIICVSDKDSAFIQKYFNINQNKIRVVENMVDKSIFYPNKINNIKIRRELNIDQNEKMILFFGQLDYKPNVEALEIIRNKIIPQLEKIKLKYKLIICGNGDGRGLLKSFKHPNLIFKGFVKRIQDYINASDVVIVPLKSGSGTRIKILETIACKTRIISTSLGAEGIKTNKLLEIEDDWKRFVEKI